MHFSSLAPSCSRVAESPCCPASVVLAFACVADLRSVGGQLFLVPARFRVVFFAVSFVLLPSVDRSVTQEVTHHTRITPTLLLMAWRIKASPQMRARAFTTRTDKSPCCCRRLTADWRLVGAGWYRRYYTKRLEIFMKTSSRFCERLPLAGTRAISPSPWRFAHPLALLSDSNSDQFVQVYLA